MPTKKVEPTLEEEVKKEILMWLDQNIIYPFSNCSEWVSLVQVIHKNTSITMVNNDKDDLIPTRIQSRCKVCIDIIGN